MTSFGTHRGFFLFPLYWSEPVNKVFLFFCNFAVPSNLIFSCFLRRPSDIIFSPFFPLLLARDGIFFGGPQVPDINHES